MLTGDLDSSLANLASNLDFGNGAKKYDYCFPGVSIISKNLVFKKLIFEVGVFSKRFFFYKKGLVLYKWSPFITKSCRFHEIRHFLSKHILSGC